MLVILAPSRNSVASLICTQVCKCKCVCFCVRVCACWGGTHQAHLACSILPPGALPKRDTSQVQCSEQQCVQNRVCAPDLHLSVSPSCPCEQSGNNNSMDRCDSHQCPCWNAQWILFPKENTQQNDPARNPGKNDRTGLSHKFGTDKFV